MTKARVLTYKRNGYVHTFNGRIKPGSGGGSSARKVPGAWT